MGKFISKISKRPIYIIFCLIIIFSLPSAIFREADSTLRLIVTALGIDKQGEEIEVCALSFMPISSTSYKENYKVFSAKGSSLASAMFQIGLYTGKKVSLAHTSILIVNEKVYEDNLIKHIDYLNRTSDISNKTVILSTTDSAKEVLQKTNELDSSSDFSIRDLVAFNSNYIYSRGSNIGSFYRGYLSLSEVSMTGVIKLSQEEGVEPKTGQAEESSGEQSSNQAGSGGPSQQNSDSSSKGQKESKILNDGSACVFKKGKFVTVLNPKEVYNYNWLNDNTYSSAFQLNNVTDEILKNADLTYSVKGKTHHSRTIMRKGKPVYDNFITITMKLEEIKQDNINKNELILYKSYFSNTAKILAQNKIRNEFGVFLKKCREEKIDVFTLYDKFNANHEKEFGNFINNLADRDDYLNYIDFNLYINFIIE